MTCCPYSPPWHWLPRRNRGRIGGWTTVTATLKTDPARQASLRFGTGGGGMVCPRGRVDR